MVDLWELWFLRRFLYALTISVGQNGVWCASDKMVFGVHLTIYMEVYNIGIVRNLDMEKSNSVRTLYFVNKNGAIIRKFVPVRK